MKLVGSLFIRVNTDGSTVAHIKGTSSNIRIATPSQDVLAGLGKPSPCRPVEGIPGQSWAFGSVECECDPNTRSVSGLKRWVDANSKAVANWLTSLDSAPVTTPAPAPAQAPEEPAPSRT